MKRIAIAVAVYSFALTAACGKSSGGGGGTALAGPPGIEAAQAVTVGGSSDLPKVIADVDAARHKIADAANADAPGSVKDDPSDLVAMLSTAAGWEAAGLDPKGELTMVTDKRVMLGGDDKPVPVPIMLFKVSDRDKLLATVAKLAPKIKLGPKDGAIEPVLHGDDTIALTGAYGDRVAVLMTTFGNAAQLRAGFEAFLKGGGPALADADAFKQAMADGPSGAGFFYWLGDMTQLDWLGHAFGLGHRARERFADALQLRVAGAGLRVAQDGTSLRVVPKESMRDGFKAMYGGTDSPKDVGRVVPAHGWAFARLSVSLEGGVAAALSAMGQSDAMLQTALGQLGLSWDEITAALSGDFGVGVDVASVLAAMNGSGAPSWISVVGVRDGDKADALVDKLAKLASDHGGLMRHDVTVSGHKAMVLGNDYASSVIARVDDLLIVAPSEVAMAAAIERIGGESLASSGAGAVLRERLAVAAVVDVAPVMAQAEGTSRYLRKVRPLFAAVADSEALRKDPVVTLRMGFDGDAQFWKLDDKGLVYRGAIAALLSSFVRMSAPPMDIPTGSFDGLTPACKAYMQDVMQCMASAPDEARKAMIEALDGVRKSPPPDDVCATSHASAKSSLGAICPDMHWSAVQAVEPTEVRPTDSAPAPATDVASAPTGTLAPSCKKYLDNVERCMAAMPEATRTAMSDAMKQTKEAWLKAPPSDAMESACKQMLPQIKESLGAMCPGVTFD